MLQEKLLFLTPHASTGGLPFYLFKQIESLINTYDIYVVEYSCVSWDYIIHRNKIINILPKNHFFTLNDDKFELLKIIEDIKPDIIHLEEIPEMFVDSKLAEKIYVKSRTYKLIETTHSSDFDVSSKVFLPDKFVFVCEFSKIQYANLDVPSEVIEFPIDIQTYNKQEFKKELNFDLNYKHIVIIGLFTPRKNQGYVFELAKQLENEKILFHFVGNQAPNFEFYWKPLMENKPKNCIIWGERGDVDKFLKAADLSLFVSKGHTGDMELNPLIIKETLEANTSLLMYNLDVYLGKYNKVDNVYFLDGDIKNDSLKILDILKIKNLNILKEKNLKQISIVSYEQNLKEIIILDTYLDTKAKEIVLNNTLNQLKKFNRDILIVAHSPIPEYIIKKVNYYIYDSDNSMDNNHTLENHGPDFWFENESFRMDTIITPHAMAISRALNLALYFVKHLGYTFFTFMEPDCVFSEDDMEKFGRITQETTNENKKLFFFKTKPDQFMWLNSVVYETMFFGGYINEFLKRFIPPNNQIDWSNLVKNYNKGYCFEYIFYEKFKNDESACKIYERAFNYFKNSKINEFVISEAVGVFYNPKDKLKPTAFIYNHDHRGRNTRYRIIINARRFDIELIHGGWWFEQLDLNNFNYDVKIDGYRDLELHRRFHKIFTKDNIDSIKDLYRLQFKK